MRRWYNWAVWIALVAESAWILIGLLYRHYSIGATTYPIFIVAVFTVLALTYRRTRWTPAFVRLLLALEFLGSVGDRFGWFGGPGTTGVSWGSFERFVGYTRQVNSFLPDSLGFPLAILATIAESVLGLALLIGLRIKLASRLSALLLLLFGTAMSISLPLDQPFGYAVFVLAAGAALLSHSDASVVSVDAAIKKSGKNRAPEKADTFNTSQMN